MTDLISRADAIEAVRKMPIRDLDRASNMTLIGKGEAIVELYSLPSAEAEPKENHTQATRAKHVIRPLGTDSIPHNGIDCTEFIHWLMEEVMDDEMWELNAVGDGEIICRKLKKLGLLEVKDGYYVWTPSAEAVDAEKLKSMKFVTIKGDKVEEAYRTGWNGAIDCVIGEYASAEAENPKVVGINDADRPKVGGIYQRR